MLDSFKAGKYSAMSCFPGTYDLSLQTLITIITFIINVGGDMKETFVVSAKMTGDLRNLKTGVTVKYFQCNWGGSSRKNGEGSRRGKKQSNYLFFTETKCSLVNFPTTKVMQLFHVVAGLIKIESNCTATATTTLSILSYGSIKAEAVLTHYGHDKELQHIRVTNWKKTSRDCS